jgi:hypothetical protein
MATSSSGKAVFIKIRAIHGFCNFPEKKKKAFLLHDSIFIRLLNLPSELTLSLP